MQLTGRIDDRDHLTGPDIDAMFALMARHYDGVDRDRFEADLREKRWVIRLLERDGPGLCGFSTQTLLDAEVGGRPIRALFSGDTIVDRDHWGTPELALAWGRLAFEVMEAHPGVELYWYLIAQGFRTYRFLPVFFREFDPRPGAATPDRVREVLDTLGSRRYPDAYDPRAGVVRASGHAYRLRPGLGEATSGRMNDPYIRFFVERNPGHVVGDELCCLAPLNRSNFSAAARRLIDSGRLAGQGCR